MVSFSTGLNMAAVRTTGTGLALGKGGSAASRLLNLIQSDVGTALIWDYARTDRRFATPTGGANPAASGDVVGLDMDWSSHGTRTYAQVIAEGGYAGPSAVPGNHATQAIGAAKPKWQAGPKPFLLYDGIDDLTNVPGLVSGASGTIVSAFRATAGIAATQAMIAGGTFSGNKRCRLALTATGLPSFVFNDQIISLPGSSDIRGTDVVMIQTWGNGRRRCYLSTYSDPLVIDEARVANMDGAGSSYKIGSLEGGASDFFSGRIYGTLIRSVETANADIRNIVLPAFRSLYA